MLHKIAVHADAVFIRIQMQPIRLQIRDMVALLQKEDVAGDFCSGILLEGVVRQADSANQIGALGQIFADGRVFLVHGSLAGNKSNNPSGPHLVQRLPKEIVVDEPVVLVVPLIYHLEIPKGDVAHRYIKEAVGHLHLFKAVHGNAGILVKLLGDTAADTVQLHTVGFAACHICREKPQKVAGAAGWL